VRYIDALNLGNNLSNNIDCFILIEPGFGYLIPALQGRFKEAKIISLHIDKTFYVENKFQTDKVSVWHNTHNLSLQDFLENEIPELDASRTRIIEWRPSMKFYGEAYLKLLSQVVEFIKQADASRRTTSVFGKKWVRNFFKNITYINKTILYKQTEIPVIVTGSGPSLENEIPVIRQMQDFCLIIAASSSILALENGGIKADIIIATDGGSWALKHIYPFFRTANSMGENRLLRKHPPESAAESALAANLCAALPSQCCSLPFLILNDGSLWQNIILHELALPSVMLQQRGTVTATAVDLALALSAGNIYLAGMDLSIKGIRTHARPYEFDHLFYNSALRLSPFYSQSFIRSGLIRDGGSMDIYAAWFRNQLAVWPKRIFYLTDTSGTLKDTPSIKQDVIKKTSGFFKTVHVNDNSVNNNGADFCKRGVNALLAAMKNSEYAASLRAELMPLLFPDTAASRKPASRVLPAEGELEKAITGAAYG